MANSEVIPGPTRPIESRLLVIQNSTPSGPDMFCEKIFGRLCISCDECISNGEVFSLKDVSLVGNLAELP
jgi:hypothetical protein